MAATERTGFRLCTGSSSRPRDAGRSLRGSRRSCSCRSSGRRRPRVRRTSGSVQPPVRVTVALVRSPPGPLKSMKVRIGPLAAAAGRYRCSSSASSSRRSKLAAGDRVDASHRAVRRSQGWESGRRLPLLRKKMAIRWSSPASMVFSFRSAVSDLSGVVAGRAPGTPVEGRSPGEVEVVIHSKMHLRADPRTELRARRTPGRDPLIGAKSTSRNLIWVTMRGATRPVQIDRPTDRRVSAVPAPQAAAPAFFAPPDRRPGRSCWSRRDRGRRCR